MARAVAAGQPLVASVLDRLIDEDPGSQSEAESSRSKTLSDIRMSLRRDLESLLNARRRPHSVPRELGEVTRSLANYGLPDLTNVNAQAEETRHDLCTMLETLLMRFETRFKSVQVHLLENTDPLDRTLRFRIEALMHAEPAPELIVFDTFVEPVTSVVNVKDSEDV
jgi:type VI secretion system protein ImpF